MNFMKSWLPNSVVEKRYARAGATFGDAVSYLYMDQCVGFEELLNN